MLFTDFVNSQYPELISKEQAVGKEIKEGFAQLVPYIVSYGEQTKWNHEIDHLTLKNA